uniref:Vacuolar ATPase assembly protein VMA22 n=1 Tax=Xenopus tropicalis TaxID=8364 RepID=A0A1B8XSR7_XENTR
MPRPFPSHWLLGQRDPSLLYQCPAPSLPIGCWGIEIHHYYTNAPPLPIGCWGREIHHYYNNAPPFPSHWLLGHSAAEEEGHTQFHIKRQEAESQNVEEIGSLDQPGLRHRRGPTDPPKPPRGHTESPGQDPLRWFGVLVPQSLRQAQSTFREGILLAAEVASLQSSVDTTQREWRLLLAEKQQLLAQRYSGAEPGLAH